MRVKPRIRSSALYGGFMSDRYGGKDVLMRLLVM